MSAAERVSEASSVEQCERMSEGPSTRQAGIVGVEEEKRQHPPSEPKRRIVGRHVGVRIEAYPSTINVTEAIFDFPSQT